VSFSGHSPVAGQPENFGGVAFHCCHPDNTESWFASRKRHVVGHAGCVGPLRPRPPARLGYSPLGDIRSLTVQNSNVVFLRTEASGDIAYRADSRIAGALREPDLAYRCVVLCDANAKAQIASRGRVGVSVKRCSRGGRKDDDLAAMAFENLFVALRDPALRPTYRAPGNSH
jgi:hypothetical protein